MEVLEGEVEGGLGRPGVLGTRVKPAALGTRGREAALLLVESEGVPGLEEPRGVTSFCREGGAGVHSFMQPRWQAVRPGACCLLAADRDCGWVGGGGGGSSPSSQVGGRWWGVGAG